MQAFVCRCLCWRWENKGLNGYREKRRGANPSLYSTYPTPFSILFPYSTQSQTLAFCMEGTRETIHSLCLEKNTCKKRDWELPGALPPVKSPVRRSSSCLESGEPLPSEVEHPASHILPLPLSFSFSLPPTFHPVRVHRDSEGASEIYLYPVWRQHHKDFFPLHCDKHMDLIFSRDRSKNKNQIGTCH